MIIIRIPSAASLPAPWQPGWEVARMYDGIPGVRRDVIARAPNGTALPAGAVDAHAPIVVTDEERAAARAHLEHLEAHGRPIERMLARRDLEDVDDVVRRERGIAHPLAQHAAWSVSTLAQASWVLTSAHDLWCSPCSSAVVRASLPDGYQAWRGIGSMIQPAGRADTYEAAEALAIAAVRDERARVMQRVRETLDGWDPATPYYSSTIERADRELPIHVSRGPITSAEAGSSWDLPVVALVFADRVERHDERVVWDDDASRARARTRKRAGDERRAEEERAAVRLLREHEVLAAICRSHHLARADVRLGHGAVVHTLGPVCMRSDGAVPLALVQDQGRRYWMALARFAIGLDSTPAGA